MWCPAKNDLSKGVCYNKSVTEPRILSKLWVNYCSHHMQGANPVVVKELKMFSCPYKGYCGYSKETFVPTYDEAAIDVAESAAVGFNRDSLCRHRVKFP